MDATTEIKAALAAAGRPIGPNDTAIAGHAIATCAILVTNNMREFERIPDFTLEDWVTDPGHRDETGSVRFVPEVHISNSELIGRCKPYHRFIYSACSMIAIDCPFQSSKLNILA